MNQNLVTAARHCAVGLLVTTMALPLQAALAADIVVSKFTDSLDGSCNSDCSLREAVQLANQTPGASRIILAAGTYRLSIAPEQGAPNPGDDLRPIDDDANLNGDLDIGGTLSVVGKGIDVTTIDAGGIDRIFEALPGAVVKLAKLTVRNGHHGSRSGGIDINVGQESCGVFAAQFEGHSGQVGAERSLAHGHTCRYRAGERHLGNVLVADQLLADAPAAVDDIQRSCRNARLDRQFGDAQQ